MCCSSTTAAQDRQQCSNYHAVLGRHWSNQALAGAGRAALMCSDAREEFPSQNSSDASNTQIESALKSAVISGKQESMQSEGRQHATTESDHGSVITLVITLKLL